MTLKNFLKIAVFGILIYPASSLQADVQTPGPDITTLQQQAKDLDNSWLNAKKDYFKKISDLIKQIETGIRERDQVLDKGDAALRKQINEERKDLERERDRMKRRLAEVSAANTVDWTKIKENFDDTVQDLTD